MKGKPIVKVEIGINTPFSRALYEFNRQIIASRVLQFAKERAYYVSPSEKRRIIKNKKYLKLLKLKMNRQKSNKAL